MLMVVRGRAKQWSSQLLIVSAWACTTSGAFAAEPETTAGASSAEPRWYGGHTLAVDAAGLAVGLGAYAATSSWRGSAEEPPTLAAYLATSMYGVGLVGAPIVHFAHGRVGTGFKDFGVRLALPPLAGLFGILGNCMANEFDDCARDGMVGGTLMGVFGVAALDALSFAKAPEPAAEEPATRWYGWQTLAVDAALMGFGAYVASRPRDPPEPGKHEYSDMLYFGIGWYAGSWLAAPIVHFANGRVGIGFADFGIRLGMPLLAAAPGVLVACSGLGGRKGCTYAGVEGGILGV